MRRGMQRVSPDPQELEEGGNNNLLTDFQLLKLSPDTLKQSLLSTS